LYETRFVTQYPTNDAGMVGGHVAAVLQATSIHPANVNLQLQEEDDTAVVTITYLTYTSQESDRVITAWRAINKRIQVERNHKLCPDKFRAIAMTGRENRALRTHLADEVTRLCAMGVSSKGILDYLQEAQAVTQELAEYVQSIRAPV
jgi:hypothetical protein